MKIGFKQNEWKNFLALNVNGKLRRILTEKKKKTQQHQIHLRAMALYRGIAGDPGGVRKFASSLGAVCLTVILCLKSKGNDICPGSRFKS